MKNGPEGAVRLPSRLKFYPARRRGAMSETVIQSSASRRLLADAEAREDLAEQVVRREFAGDGRKRLVGEPQLLREQFPQPCARRSLTQMPGCVPQRPQMTLPGEKHRFAVRAPTRRLQDPLAQRVDPGAGLRGYADGGMPAGWRGEAWGQVDLVVDVDARRRGRRFERGPVPGRRGVVHRQQQIGARHFTLRALDAEALDFVARLA